MKDTYFDKMITDYKKATDTEKMRIVLDLRLEQINQNIEQFLLEIIRTSHFDKLRIAAAMNFKGYKSDTVKSILLGIYNEEKNDTVRLALVNVLITLANEKKEYVTLLDKETNDVIKANLLKNIVVEKMIEEESIEPFLLDLIKQGEGEYTVSLALELLKGSITEKGIQKLEEICRRKIKKELKNKIHNKLVAYARDMDYALSYIDVSTSEDKKGKKNR